MGLEPDKVEFAGVSQSGDVSACSRHFLIITAPFGPFSSELAKILRSEGARCSRVVSNGGDVCDWGLKFAHFYFGDLSGWSAWLEATIEREGVTDLILHGDTAPFCARARRLGAALSLRVHVLEQGYFRPFWITLERDGVNVNSRLPRDPETYLREAETTDEAPAVWLPPLTPPAVVRISAYHFAQWLCTPVFPAFRPPYAYAPTRQAISHSLRFLRHRLFRRRYEARLAHALDTAGPVFVALLQRPGDSQLVKHSPFPDQFKYVQAVIDSFTLHASANARLIFKSHPLDHGIEPHEAVIARHALARGVGERVFFCDRGDLDLLLRRATSVVTINSTAGLAAIEHGVPTIVLGEAIYDIPGLTHRRGLDQLWTQAEPPVSEVYQAFRRVVMARSQINGAYATRRGVALAAPEVARRLLTR